jgi:adenylate cyclase
MPVIRRLAAILAADVAGYSRLMGVDEEGTLTRLKAHRRHAVDPKIQEHNGRIVKTTGDGLLLEFPSVVDAVRCAVEVQREMLDRNAEIPDDKRIAFRVGINLGDVIIEGSDIYGDGVNIAARLEALAEPGGICVSRVVRDQIRDKLPYPFEDMGEQRVKNIARPVRTYAITAVVMASLPPIVTPKRQRPARQRPKPQPDIPRLSIVVLPFTNLSNDPEQEYFADGITDDLTTDLSRIPGSFVIARNTAFTYKGKSVDVKQIGRELGVRYVLEGSVRRMGEQVRVNVQLIDAETGAHLWAERFDTDRQHLVQAQSEITGRLARTLNIQLLQAADRQIDLEKTINPDARDLVMRGWAFFYQPPSIGSREKARRAFERALKIDPRSIDAKLGLARILVVNLADGWSKSAQQDTARAEGLLAEALEHDANRAAAHVAMGQLRRVQNRLSEAQIEFETTIALDRNDPIAYTQLGRAFLEKGQPDAAIGPIETAIRLSPHDPMLAVSYQALGACYLLLGQVDKAADLLRKARVANPRYWFVHLWLAGTLGLKGELDEARSAVAESLRLKPEVDSIARWRSERPMYTNPQFTALAEKTLCVGLRRAGFPEE